MGIGEAHQIEHPLYRPVLPRHAVERVEDDIGLGLMQAHGDIAAHVDAGDAVALAFQRIGHARAAGQRDGAFIGPAAHQDSDVQFRKAHGRPTL